MKYLFILTLFIFSCTQDNLVSEKFITNQLQENNLSEFAKGEESYCMILDALRHNSLENNLLIERSRITTKYLTEIKKVENEYFHFFNNLKIKSLEKNQH